MMKREKLKRKTKEWGEAKAEFDEAATRMLQGVYEVNSDEDLSVKWGDEGTD